MNSRHHHTRLGSLLNGSHQWALEVAEAVKVPTLHKKRKWSAPGPDKITNF